MLTKRNNTDRPTEIVLVANEKGGCGKSTTCLCLGNVLTALGYKVLIIDFDPSANLSYSALSAFPDRSLYDVFDKKIPISDIIVETPFGYVAPAVKELVNLDGDFSAPVESKSLTEIASRWIGMRGSDFMLASYLRKDKRFNIHDYFDFVIIDSAPSDNNLITNAVLAADSVIVPCELSAASVNGLRMFVSTIASTNTTYNMDIYFDGLLTVKYSEKTSPDRNMAQSIEELCSSSEALNHPYETKVRLSSSMRNVMDKGEPVLNYLANGYAATDSINMALEFLHRRGLSPKLDFPGVTKDETGRYRYVRPLKKEKEA